MKPVKKNLHLYSGNTFGMLFTFKKQDEQIIDVQTFYESMRFIAFLKESESSPLINYTLTNGLTVSSNEVTVELSPEQVNSLDKVDIYWKLIVQYSGKTKTYFDGHIHVHDVDDPQGSQSAGFNLTVNPAADIYQVSVADNAAIALTAKNETQQLKEEVENLKQATDDNVTATNQNAQTATTKAGEASASADKSEKYAEEDEDVEVEPGKFSAKHHSAKSAGSATTATDEANRAETEADRAETAANVKDRAWSGSIPFGANFGFQEDNGEFYRITGMDLARFITEVKEYNFNPITIAWAGTSDPSVTVTQN